MRKRTSVSLGPGAPSLILIFVALSMAILGMLTLMTARNDLRLSERSAEVMEAVYELNSRAEETAQKISEGVHACAAEHSEENAFLEALPGFLPEDTDWDGKFVSWQEADESRILDCAVKVETDGENVRTVWERHNLSATIADVFE